MSNIIKPEMLGVSFNTDSDTPYLDCNSCDYYIPFEKDEEYFEVYENLIRFLKKTENLVRTNSFYDTYKNYIINVVGMRSCQVLPGIKVSEDKKQKTVLELHHGPMLNLFDVCMIMLRYLLIYEPNHLTTFYLARRVLEEHRENRVRVMLLSKSVHLEVNNNNIFLNYNMGFGDVNTFLNLYMDGVSKNMKDKINQYIELSEKKDSYDNNIFEISKTMRKWKQNDFDDLENLLNEWQKGGTQYE